MTHHARWRGAARRIALAVSTGVPIAVVVFIYLIVLTRGKIL